MIRGLNKITTASGLGYVMSSYTAHTGGFDDAEVEAKDVAAHLTLSGLVVFAPIAYGPGIHRHMTCWPGTADSKYLMSHEFWMPICERFFRKCDYGIVATTKGWHKSVGIAIELGAISAAGKPVWFYDPEAEAILSIAEAGDKWPEEMEQLLKLAAENFGRHLNTSNDAYTQGIAAVLAQGA